YEQGTVIPVSATPAPDKVFKRWMRGNVEVSDEASFSFTMPPAHVMLTAFFEDKPVPPPEPEPDPEPQPPPPIDKDSYYPLEIRVNGIGIPITSLTRKNSTGIFTPDLVGDYSFPISIPLDESLMVALGLPNDPQTSFDFSHPFPAELWKHGNRIYKGTL